MMGLAQETDRLVGEPGAGREAVSWGSQPGQGAEVGRQWRRYS